MAGRAVGDPAVSGETLLVWPPRVRPCVRAPGGRLPCEQEEPRVQGPAAGLPAALLL